MRVVEGLVPHGGWHFKQRLVSSPQRPQHQIIKASGYSQLLDNVLSFRLNNLEIVATGSATKELVEQDVSFYICGNWPHTCTGSRADLALLAAGKWPGPVRRTNYQRPLTRIEDWITRLGQENLRWVDHARAVERSNVCIQCPMNQAWRTGCTPCNENAIRRAMLIRGNHATGLEKKLRYCVSYGTLLELSVWLEQDFSTERRSPPPECWKLQHS